MALVRRQVARGPVGVVGRRDVGSLSQCGAHGILTATECGLEKQAAETRALVERRAQVVDRRLRLMVMMMVMVVVVLLLLLLLLPVHHVCRMVVRERLVGNVMHHGNMAPMWV